MSKLILLIIPLLFSCSGKVNLYNDGEVIKIYDNKKEGCVLQVYSEISGLVFFKTECFKYNVGDNIKK